MSFVNLYHVPKDHGKCKFNEDAFRQATSFLTQTKDKPRGTSFQYDRIVSCYKPPNDVYMSCGTTIHADGLSSTLNLCRLFFPLWILPALVPADCSKVLHISNVTVAHFSELSVEPCVANANLSGCLKIAELHVLCNKGKLAEVSECIDRILSEFKCISITSKPKVSEKWEDLIHLIKLDITQHESPHTMFGSCHGIPRFYQLPPVAVSEYGSYGDCILIATLGYGHNTHPFLNEKIAKIQVKDSHNFQKIDSEVESHWFTHSWIVHEYAAQSKFFIAQTTDEHGIIVNGTTAEAIKWLREKWTSDWNKDFDNLIILIPYGGQYMEDEMKAITEATDESIIIVCAAGDCREGGGGDVVFPAALGTVISVGVAGTGPKGREVDVSVDFASRPATLPGVKNPVHLPEDCGTAAARIAGLLSLLLARINNILKSTEHSIIKDIINKMRLKPMQYMHICVIRELLVNEGSGKHDPQLGYGNGEDIITSLLTMEESHLLQRLANVVIRNYEIRFLNITKKLVKINPVSRKDRETLYSNLDGSNITVAVIDEFCIHKEFCIHGKEIEQNVTSFKDLGSLHGEQCATIVKTICPNSAILCVNSEGTTVKGIASAFDSCLKPSFKLPTGREVQIDIISCSIGCFHFTDLLCKSVNKAVRAGKIIVCAAGNKGPSHSNTIGYPGRQGNILVIGERDESYSRVGSSSVGREMDFLAEIRQPHKSTDDPIRGTSYAAPVVAGYIALLLQFIKEKMITDKDEVTVWLDNRWQKKSAFEAARNVYAMRELLKLFVVKPQEHTEKEGYGCLDFATLFPHYQFSKDIAKDMAKDKAKDIAVKAKKFVEDEAKKKIQKTLQHFYKRDY